MKKKILILLSILIFTVTLSAASVSAANIASGTCDNGMTWYINDSGTLKITGTGEMDNYDYGDLSAPWKEYYSSINSIVISTGITHIGDCAFSYLTNLTKVTFSSTVTSIGDNAFDNCSKLAIVKFPEGLTKIGSCAFLDCDALTEITIPKSVASFGEGSAFAWCSALKKVTLLTDAPLSYHTFAYCDKLEKVDAANGVFFSRDGAFNHCSSLKNITISSKQLVINSYTFSGCAALEYIIFLGNNSGYSDLGKIETYAFSGCDALEKIYYTGSKQGWNSVTKESKGNDNLLSATVIYRGTLFFNIGSSDSGTMKSLSAKVGSSVTFPENGFTKEGGVFEGWLYENKIYKPGDSIIMPEYTGKYDPVYPIWHSDMVCGDNLISTFSDDGTLTISGTGYMYDYQNLDSFTPAVWWRWLDVKKVVIGDGVKSVGENAFNNMYGITSVVISDSVQSIGDYAFYYCPDLKEITIGQDVYSIGKYAFAKTYALEKINWVADCVADFPSDNHIFEYSGQKGNGIEIVFTGGNIPNNLFFPVKDKYEAYLPFVKSVDFGSVTRIGGASFRENKQFTELVIPDSVTEIGVSAFANCSNVKEIILGKNVATIGNSAFYGLTLLEKFYWNSVNVADFEYENTVFNRAGRDTEDGVEFVFGNGAKTLPAYAFMSGSYYPSTPKFKSLDLGTVESIGKGAFTYCNTLTRLEMPSTLKKIGSYAFSSSSISEIHINDLASWCKIEFEGKEASVFRRGDGSLISNVDLYVNGEKVTKLVIPVGVTSIPDGAFAYCDAIESLVLKGTVETVGKEAFYSCKRLKDANTGSGLADLGDYAFWGCKVLERVTFGTGIRKIGSYAFLNTASLKTVTIPEGLEEVGEFAFRNCSTITNMTLPKTLKNVGRSAFSNCGVSGELIFESPVTVGESAFSGSKITSVAFGDNEATIGKNAFNKCTELVSLTIGKNVTSIDLNAFDGCSSLTEINWNTNKISKFTTANKIFNGIDAEKKGIELTFGEGVTRIPDYIFYGTSDNKFKIASLTLPTTLTEIGNAAFSYCNIDGDVKLGNKVTKIGSNAFYANRINGILTIPASVTYIGSYAFNSTTISKVNWNVPSITPPVDYLSVWFENAVIGKFVFGNTVTDIPENLLLKADKITNLTIGKSVKTIGEDAFCNIERLDEIYWNASEVDSVESSVFYNTGGALELTCGEGITAFPANLFNGSKITNITLPSSITEIKEGTFRGCSNLTEIVIPDNITHIGKNAFYNCSKLVKVTMGNNVKTVEAGAFYNCENIEGVYADSLENWCKINFGSSDSNPVKYAKKLYIDNTLVTGKLVVPDGVAYVGDYAFCNCDLVTGVKIPDSITKIGTNAFSYNENLTEVDLGNGLTEIGTYAFYETSVKSIVIPADVKVAGNGSFANCKALDNVTFLNKTLSGGSSMFSGCTSLKEIVLPENMETIESSMFGGCISLEKVTFPKNVKKLGDSAFYDCTALTEITIPDTVTEIWNSVFSGCTGLKKVKISENAKVVNTYAFYECTGIEEIVIPDSVETMGNAVFCGCTGLKKVTLSRNLKGGNLDSLFYGCSSLTEVEIPDGVENLSYACFRDCTSLTNAVLGSGIKTIEAYAFANCSNLKTITIKSNLNNVYDYAFSGCERLSDVYFMGDSWSKVSIKTGNNDLLTAKIHYATTVSFDGNGASEGNVPAIITSVGSVVTLPENGFYRMNYEFKGWSDGTTIYQPGDSYTVKGNVTFSALWQKVALEGTMNRVLLDYDGYYRYYINDEIQTKWQVANNGYKYYFSTSSTKYGAAMVGSNVKIGADYYDFDSEGRLIEDYDSNGDPILYYDESKDVRITVAYNLNGGDTLYGEKTVKVYPGDEADLTVKADKKGYIFRGWSLNKYASIPMDWDVFVKENTVLYAVFTRNTKWKVVLEDDGYYRYYIDNWKQTGWQITPDGYKYYFSTSVTRYGAAMTGKRVKIGGKYYDFTNDGKLIDHYDSNGNPVLFRSRNGFFTENGITRYYVDNEYLTGWQYIDGNKYYFSKSSGKMLSGMQKIGSVYYNLGTDGAWVGYSRTGYTEEECPASPLMNKDDDGEYRYYVNGEPYTGWKVLIGEDGYYKYYFSKADGAAKTDYAIQVGSQVYDFTASGALITVEKDENGEAKMEIYKLSFEQGSKNGLTLDDDGEYRFYIDGEFQSGWIVVNGSKYLFRKADGSAITADDHQSSAGYRYGSFNYLFDSKGKLLKRTPR